MKCNECGSSEVYVIPESGEVECFDCGAVQGDDGTCERCGENHQQKRVWAYDGGGESGGVNGPFRLCFDCVLHLRETRQVVKEERIATDNHCRNLEVKLTH